MPFSGYAHVPNTTPKGTCPETTRSNVLAEIVARVMAALIHLEGRGLRKAVVFPAAVPDAKSVQRKTSV